MIRDMQSILQETLNIVSVKEASLKKRASDANSVKENPPESVGTMIDVSEDAKSPTPKSRGSEMDRNVDERRGRSTNGVGDDSDVTRGHALEADESVEEPQKKPLQSDDANAKSAGFANDLLAAIRGYQQLPVKSAQEAEEEAKKEEGEREEGEEESEKVEAKKKKKEEDPSIKLDEMKAASGADRLELDNEILRKIGAYVLATEEGVDMVRSKLEKEAGSEAAESLINYFNEKTAAEEYSIGQATAQELVHQAIYGSGVEAGLATGTQLMQKAASGTLNQDDVELIKLGQAIADQSAADLAGAMGGEAGPEPEAGGEAGPEPEADDDEEISIDDLAAALEQLVQSGVIQPDDVQKILDYLSAGDAGAPEEAPGAPEEAPGAPEEAPAMPEQSDKEASARAARVNKLACNIAANIGAARSVKK